MKIIKEKMNFGEAIEHLKEGGTVRRSGWNGKGMFLFMVGGSEVQKESLRNDARRAAFAADDLADKSHVTICPHIDMKAADGSIVVGWLASQTDMLSNDWELVE